MEPSQRASALAELRQNSEQASEEIKQMVQQKRLEYKRVIQQKIAEGQRYVQSLGGASPAQIQTVQKGITAVKKKIEQPDDAFVIADWVYGLFWHGIKGFLRHVFSYHYAGNI